VFKCVQNVGQFPVQHMDEVYCSWRSDGKE